MKIKHVLILSVAALSAISTASSIKEGQILVKLSQGTQSADARYSAISGRVIRRFPQIGWEVVSIPLVTKAKGAAQRAISLPGVTKAEVSTIGRWESVPNDPFYRRQYGPQRMNVPTAWDYVPSTSAVKIMVLDSGVSQSHPDLQSQIAQAMDFSGSGAGAEDLNGHGSHVAGITAAATGNSIGIAGVARNCQLVCGKVGDAAPESDALIAGITWAADNGPKVIQMSLSVGDSQALLDAVDYAWSKDVVVIDAAGNSDTSDEFFPASYENCIAVAATDRNDRFADFSNYGSWVDVAAPGVDIFSTYASGGYATLSGTSMAAPHVSGVAGLLFSFNPTATAQEVRDALENTTVPLGNQRGKTVVHGRINALAALLTLTVLETSGPDSVNVLQGTGVATSPTNLLSEDGRSVIVRAQEVRGVGGVAAFESDVPLTRDISGAISGTLSVTASALNATTQQLYLWNYTTNRFELIKASPLRLTMTTAQFPISSLTNYVREGALKIQLRTVVPGRFGRVAYSYLVDQVQLSVRYRP